MFLSAFEVIQKSRQRIQSLILVSLFVPCAHADVHFAITYILLPPKFVPSICSGLPQFYKLKQQFSVCLPSFIQSLRKSLDQWFPTWGPEPPGGSRDTERGAVRCLSKNNLKNIIIVYLTHYCTNSGYILS